MSKMQNIDLSVFCLLFYIFIAYSAYQYTYFIAYSAYFNVSAAYCPHILHILLHILHIILHFLSYSAYILHIMQ